MAKRLLYVLRQPDFRAQPVRAVWRRVLWRLHHALNPGRPVVMGDWYRGMRIVLPRSGSAAQVFYRRHSSAEIVQVMEEVLEAGHVVVDVGAHIGEYTLIGASLVGNGGRVYAVEPQPYAAQVIALNARLNGFENIHVREVALADRAGTMPFRRDPRSWGGFLAYSGTEAASKVECTTLDDFVEKEGISRVHLIKLDAMGNEKAVLLGGRRLLTSREAPAIVCKLYHPRVVRERFGYEARESLALLESWGYELRLLTGGGKEPISPRNCYELFSRGDYGLAVLARREGHE
jgi:FkbM family methyltransferase